MPTQEEIERLARSLFYRIIADLLDEYPALQRAANTDPSQWSAVLDEMEQRAIDALISGLGL